MILPLILGMMAVLQGAINREVSKSWGLPYTAFFSNLTTIVLCIVFIIWAKHWGSKAAFLTGSSNIQFKWWFLLPGLFGFSIVAGLPWAIHKFGALKVTAFFVCAQMITSIIWDLTMLKIPITTTRLLAALFGFLSVALLAVSKYRPE